MRLEQRADGCGCLLAGVLPLGCSAAALTMYHQVILLVLYTHLGRVALVVSFKLDAFQA